MEWHNNHLHNYSPFEDTMHGLVLHIDNPTPAGWTFEENNLFERAIAEINPAAPGFFEHIHMRIPWKQMDEIKIHYQELVHDLEMIESGMFPDPDYKDSPEKQDEADTDMEYGSPSNESRTRSGQQRRRGVPWTEEEHQFFLMGLNKFGKGDWRSISRYYVITKTPTQVASHAQKYFRRQTSSTPVDRRRPSIHDIQTVNPIGSSSIPQAQTNCNEFAPLALVNPMVYNNFNGGMMVEQNNMFMPMNSSSVFQPDEPVLGQPSDCSYLLPPLPDQWY